MALPIIKSIFYANGKAVWSAEWYEPLSEEKIKENIDWIAERGLGDVEAMTDTTGRYITFVNGEFLREVEEDSHE